MKIVFDEKAKATYLKLNTNEIIKTKELTELVNIDFDAHNQVVGIEILNVLSLEVEKK